MILTLFIIATATFFLLEAVPGDPLTERAEKLPVEARDALYARYGLDKPVMERYVTQMANMLQGDFGESDKSFSTGRGKGSVRRRFFAGKIDKGGGLGDNCSSCLFARQARAGFLYKWKGELKLCCPEKGGALPCCWP